MLQEDADVGSVTSEDVAAEPPLTQEYKDAAEPEGLQASPAVRPDGEQSDDDDKTLSFAAGSWLDDLTEVPGPDGSPSEALEDEDEEGESTRLAEEGAPQLPECGRGGRSRHRGMEAGGQSGGGDAR